MNRRNLLRVLSISAIFLLVSPMVISTEGCNSNNVVPIVNSILQSSENIIAVTNPNAPWLESFKDSVSAVQAAEATWQGGGNIAILESALNTLAAVTAVIPTTAQYSPLIDVLVAGIETVLANVAPPKTATALTIYNPHRGRALLKKPHLLQSRVGAYKEQWNATADSIGLPSTKLK